MWLSQELLKLQICPALASFNFFPKGRSLHRRTKKHPTKQPWAYMKTTFHSEIELNVFVLKPECFYTKLLLQEIIKGNITEVAEQEGLGCILGTRFGQLQIQGIWKMLLSIMSNPLKLSSYFL